ncbi:MULTISPECIES: hypothetical protein [Serratia]|uniref:hypothetical protein n=1 Tax=Serratia TaxID=613 RepID=UPI000DFF67EE|nr:MULTISPECIES: hypothetical protein [Serratia]MDW5500050.1 hypothetical protein [Serratia proteamaculans]MDW5505115.1 hypothetical protein [Pseudomonas lundensis]SUI80786.1 Uncharacterised protein [Serratia liquefaciens]
MSMPTSHKPKLRFRRVAVIFLVIVAVTAALFLFASVLFEVDPDGHKVRGWLSASRYGLFVWRLTIYTVLGWAWFCVVRPQVMKKSPGSTGSALRRLEWTAAGFILVLELAAWRSVLA